MPAFLVCLHDATPAFAAECRAMVRELAPLIGRRFASGVVPDWDGAWPLAAHRDYCAWLADACEERLLHGYHHRRRRGRGPATWLTDGRDEMNGLGPDETRRTIQRGQHDFIDAFGEPAHGFLPPAWQRGHVSTATAHALGVQYVLGFFSVAASAERRVPLATWTWDCGRWGWLGHGGHAIGRLLHLAGRGVPTLAIHPRDRARGYWPAILRLVRELLDAGYEPSTPGALLEAPAC